MAKSDIIAVISLVIIANAQPLFAQHVGLELQLGPGYIYDSGEGPSTPTMNVGAIFWFANHIGLGGRFTLGMRDDHFQPPQQADDRTFLGPGSARQAAFTFQFRSFQGHAAELNLGLGFSQVAYQDETILIGIRRSTGEIEAISPQTVREQISTEAIRTEVFIGRNFTEHINLKGGFTFDLTGDVHPFQPMVLLGFRFP
jgi:hypothetical protein